MNLTALSRRVFEGGRGVFVELTGLLVKTPTNDFSRAFLSFGVAELRLPNKHRREGAADTSGDDSVAYVSHRLFEAQSDDGIDF